MLQKLFSAKVAYFEMTAIGKMFQYLCLFRKIGKEFISRRKLGESVLKYCRNISCITQILQNTFQ